MQITHIIDTVLYAHSSLNLKCARHMSTLISHNLKILPKAKREITALLYFSYIKLKLK